MNRCDRVPLSEDTLELELTPASGVAQPITEDMIGAIARIANPDEAPYVLHGFVIDVDTGNNVFYIDDPTGALYALLTASANAMLTVFDNYDTGINEEAVHTAGTWGEESIEFSEELGGVTVFTTSSTFPAQAVGWTLQPNANRPIFFPILGVSGGSITVAGDLTGVAQAGDQYFILHPPGIDKTNGAVNTNATEQTTRYLAFGYQYITPMAGVHTGSAIEGRQAGNNLAGQYQVWNRNYLPDIGRWTTTDPAAMPWWNLLDYIAQAPTFQVDPTGLSWVGLLKKIWDGAGAADDGAKTGSNAFRAFRDLVDQAIRNPPDRCKSQMDGFIQEFCAKLCDDIPNPNQKGLCTIGCLAGVESKKDELVRKLCDDPDRASVLADLDPGILQKDYGAMDATEIASHIREIKRECTGATRKRKMANAWRLCIDACETEFQNCMKGATTSKQRRCVADNAACKSKCEAYYKEAR